MSGAAFVIWLPDGKKIVTTRESFDAHQIAPGPFADKKADTTFGNYVLTEDK